MLVEVITYYLELTSAECLRPSNASVAELEIRQSHYPCPELNRFLYTAVGGDWFWVDRLQWTYQQWLGYLCRSEQETWVAYVSGTPAGYFELEMQTGGSVELVYFGLLGQFIGRGIGGLLLTAAVNRAWQMGAKRVWVHTCSLDSPAALSCYRSRGFQIYEMEKSMQELPDKTPGVWPGAEREM